MAKWRRPSTSSFSPSTSSPRAKLEAAKGRARALLDQGDFEGAASILEPLNDDFSNDWEVLMMLGTCYGGLNEFELALDCYEEAYAASKKPVLLFPLGISYLRLNMLASAMHAFNESARRGLPLPMDMGSMLDAVRTQIGEVARTIGVPTEKAIPAFRETERAVRLLAQSDYRAAIVACRAAIKVLGDWPPPHLDLAEALLNDGQGAAAITELRQILARAPGHIHAAGTLVRYLAWTGDRPAAEQVWETLRTHVPADLPFEAIDLAAAAAILDHDEDVRRFLRPLADWPRDKYASPQSYARVQRFLAIAEANLGDAKSAKRRLQALKDADDPQVHVLREALRLGRSSLGLNDRFSYYTSLDVMLSADLNTYSRLSYTLSDHPDDASANKAMTQFVARHPQFVLVAEKLIWEEGSVDLGLVMLRLLGTPAAHAALRRFAGSQVGSDEQRMHAIMYLQMSGGAQRGEKFTLWQDGAWHELALRNYTIGPHKDRPPYKAKVQKLLDEGELAIQEERWVDGAELMRRVIELEPRAVDAYNNLAVTSGRMGDSDASVEYLRRAIEINPHYVFARVNLALDLAGSDLDAAADMLAPLEAVTHFTSIEFPFYLFGLARIADARGDTAAARNSLRLALAYDPDFALAANLLAEINAAEFKQFRGPIWDRARERFKENAARYRLQQQAKLKTLTPTVSDAVGVYTAEILRPILRAVLPWLSLTKLRKADLQRQLITSLPEPATITAIIEERLNAAERGALAAVLSAGGAMPRAQFRAEFGDDTDESPHWQYNLPTSVVGRLRLHCLLTETTVGDTVYLVIPVEVRGVLGTALQP